VMQGQANEFPPYKDGSFNAGLWCLAQVAEPEEIFSREAIAEVCGCTQQNIARIENRVLKKMREKFKEDRFVHRALRTNGRDEITTFAEVLRAELHALDERKE
jgi:hypothetical protein